MKYLSAYFGVLICLLFAMPTHAESTEIIEFKNELTKLRYKTLTTEMRCPKCQNQNLADSNSLQAGDLRREILNMLNANKSDQEIVDFMVYRYGDFVLYRPKVNSMTYVLWYGPFALILFGVIAVVIATRKRATTDNDNVLSVEQQAELDELLKKDNSL